MAVVPASKGAKLSTSDSNSTLPLAGFGMSGHLELAATKVMCKDYVISMLNFLHVHNRGSSKKC